MTRGRVCLTIALAGFALLATAPVWPRPAPSPVTAPAASPTLFSSPALSSAPTPSPSPPQTQQAIPPPAAATSPAQKPESSFNVQGEIRFYARRWRQEADRIIADGDAEVHYKGLTLFAEHIEIDTKTKDVLAVGSVVLHVGKPPVAHAAPPAKAPAKPATDTPPITGVLVPVPAAPTAPPASNAPSSALTSAPLEFAAPDQVINAEQLEFNLDTAEGRLSKAFGMMQPTLFFEAASMERRDGIDRMDRMSFTTCTQPTPRWTFSCRRAEL